MGEGGGRWRLRTQAGRHGPARRGGRGDSRQDRTEDHARDGHQLRHPRESDYHRYNSFKGVVGGAFDNVLDRDFSADEPWQKLGTGATEFKAPWAGGLLCPSVRLRQQGDRVLEHIAVCEHGAAKGDAGRPAGEDAGGREPGPVMHSDMGWQYQHDGYCKTLEEAGIVQSMSRRATASTTPRPSRSSAISRTSSSAGRASSFEEFKERLEAYIVHWNTRRRQVKLKGLTPEEFRNQSLAA